MSPKKNNVSMICDIGELSGLFEKSRNLEDFLHTVVNVVAYHMASAVCSVYLLDDEHGDLVLTANQGLNPKMIGTLRLKLGEGLVGVSLKELRSIREGCASRNPYYKYVPGSNEDQYESFLAVPILRGLTRIGVLVVQDTQRDYFTENDQQALHAIATQLASAVENARLFMSLYDRGEGLPVIVEDEDDEQIPIFYKGVVASKGFAWGRATVIGKIDSYMRLTEEMLNHRCTIEQFNEALHQTELQLEELQNQLQEHFSDVASMIFSAHILILKDSQFHGEMLRLMTEEGRSPQRAVTEVVNGYVAMFAKKTNPLFQEKIQDIKDVGHRLLHNMFQLEEMFADYEDEVVVSGDLLPSDIVKLSTQHAAGLIMVGSGVTSHISILARSMELPVVLVEDERIFDIPEGARILMDATMGSIFLNPGEDIIRKYKDSLDAHENAGIVGSEIKSKTLTHDRVKIRLLANINLLNELNLADRYKAEGVGLYRSEFPFIVRNGFPSEEEQYRIYRTIVEHMDGQPVTLRTLDIGGDKMLSYFPTVREDNPFLGLRALRFTLQNKEIFVEQLRAMLRAGRDADFAIMFPMVASVDEFVQAKEIVLECSAQLTEQGVPHNPRPKMGPMIELPSAVEVARELAEEADFLCVGTNDLVQYILAVDRTNESLAHYYVNHHPAVLRALKRIAAAGQKRNIPVSICGEMASNAEMIPFLIGIGIRALSMDAKRIPAAQATINKVNSRRAQRQAEVMLNMGRISDLAEFIEQQTRSQ